MLSKYQEEYYRYFLEGREDYKNYEYHLEGVIALFDKGEILHNLFVFNLFYFFSW